ARGRGRFLSSWMTPSVQAVRSGAYRGGPLAETKRATILSGSVLVCVSSVGPADRWRRCSPRHAGALDGSVQPPWGRTLAALTLLLPGCLCGAGPGETELSLYLSEVTSMRGCLLILILTAGCPGQRALVHGVYPLIRIHPEAA